MFRSADIIRHIFTKMYEGRGTGKEYRKTPLSYKYAHAVLPNWFCDGPIPRPAESYRVWCVWVWRSSTECGVPECDGVLPSVVCLSVTESCRVWCVWVWRSPAECGVPECDGVLPSVVCLSVTESCRVWCAWVWRSPAECGVPECDGVLPRVVCLIVTESYRVSCAWVCRNPTECGVWSRNSVNEEAWPPGGCCPQNKQTIEQYVRYIIYICAFDSHKYTRKLAYSLLPHMFLTSK